jgi:hypothetical protein
MSKSQIAIVGFVGCAFLAPASWVGLAEATTPTITSLTPASGNASGGYTVTIAGSSFNTGKYSSSAPTNGNTVRIHRTNDDGLTDLTGINTTSSTSLTFTMPDCTSYGATSIWIEVNGEGNNGGGTSGHLVFTFVAPTASSLNVTSGNISGGYPVTITGANFNITTYDASTNPTGGNTIRVHTTADNGLTDLTGINTTSSTQLTFTMPDCTSYGQTSIWLEVNGTGNNTGGNSGVPGGNSGHLVFTFASPTITSISPTSGNMIGGYPVTITGTFFNVSSTLNTVRIHDLAGAGISGGDQLNITATSSTSITFTMPNLSSLGLPGVTIQVNNLGNNTGATTSGSATFSFPPTTTSLSPSSGNISGGYPVTITGTNFNVSSTQNTVRVHTLEGAGLADQLNITAASSTSITFTMPNLASLTTESGITIQVNNLGANTGTTSSGSLTFTFAAPTVTSLSPTHGAATGGYPVTIAGTNFNVSNTLNTVRIHNLANGGNTPSTDQLNITATSSTSITFTMPNLLSTGLPGVIIQVNNLGNNTGATGGQITFAFDPTVTAVSPASASVIGGSVTITGTNFIDLNNVPASQVFFGTSPASSFTVNSATSITAVAPPGSPGSVDVTVVVASTATSPTSSADLYSYQAPTISSATPNPVGAGAGAVVTINGQYFTGINTNALSSVTFGGVNAASITFVSDTQITALPTYPGSGSGIAVTVGSSTTSFSGWSFAGPSITSVSPNAADIAGNTPVIITGQYFTGINTNALSSVTFAGVSAQSITFVSDTQLRAITAPSSAGTGSVAVTVGSLTGSFAPFAYGGDKVSSINPASGPISGGTTVTISGVGFSGILWQHSGDELHDQFRYLDHGCLSPRRRWIGEHHRHEGRSGVELHHGRPVHVLPGLQLPVDDVDFIELVDAGRHDHHLEFADNSRGGFRELQLFQLVCASDANRRQSGQRRSFRHCLELHHDCREHHRLQSDLRHEWTVCRRRSSEQCGQYPQRRLEGFRDRAAELLQQRNLFQRGPLEQPGVLVVLQCRVSRAADLFRHGDDDHDYQHLRISVFPDFRRAGQLASGSHQLHRQLRNVLLQQRLLQSRKRALHQRAVLPGFAKQH